MISKADRRLLNETYRNAGMAIEAIYSVIDKIQDEELALELTRQVGKYNSIQDRAEEELNMLGEKPDNSYLGKAMIKLSMKRKMMKNKGASHIADLFIQGNTKGIVSTTRCMHDNLTAKRDYCELAGELVEFEHVNIDRMKMFL